MTSKGTLAIWLRSLAETYLPRFFVETSFLDVELWQWFGILNSFLIAIVGAYFLSFGTRKALCYVAKKSKWDWDDRLIDSMRGPLVLIFFALILAGGLRALSISSEVNNVLVDALKFITAIAAGWFLIRVVNLASELLIKTFSNRSEMGLAMVPVVQKIARPMVIILIALFVLHNLGVNITGLVAGLGIGGLALAMAGKTTVENLLGGITIAFDRAFKIGDTIRVDGVEGTVETVGLRSTKIRTADRTLITIPNGKLVDWKIENFAARDRFRFVTTVPVDYETSMSDMRAIIQEMQAYLKSQPKIWPDGQSVRLLGYTAPGLSIEVSCWIKADDGDEFAAIRDELTLVLGESIVKKKARFARNYPLLGSSAST